MSLVEAQQQQQQEKRLSPTLTGTNNPFRKSAASPGLSSPSAFPPPPTNSNPKNPFVDAAEMTTATAPPRSPGKMTDEELLMKELRLTDASRRPENRRPPPPRPLNGSRPRGPDGVNIFADPPQRRHQPGVPRPRRNSEGSIVDRKALSPEEEQKRRERKQREREARTKDSKGRPIPSRSKTPNRKLDVIDKLDVTSIFGIGAFHHDGPFDACNPHRNRKGSARAPMAAFPEGSANNMLGGSGPLKKNIDLDQFHGRIPDSFDDFSAPAAPSGRKNSSNQMEPFVGHTPRTNPNAARASVLNTNTNIEPVHGDESLGLGTSTFLEGAPAARSAIQRTASEQEENGLTRKKSLAQKIRGVSNSRATRGHDVISPGAQWGRNSPEVLGTQSAGGLAKINETNPFFQDYDAEYEKKGASIRVAETQRAGEASGADGRPSSRDLNRVITSDSAADGEDGKSSGGFLNRVKSLRSKKRPERKE